MVFLPHRSPSFCKSSEFFQFDSHPSIRRKDTLKKLTIEIMCYLIYAWFKCFVFVLLISVLISVSEISY